MLFWLLAILHMCLLLIIGGVYAALIGGTYSIILLAIAHYIAHNTKS